MYYVLYDNTGPRAWAHYRNGKVEMREPDGINATFGFPDLPAVLKDPGCRFSIEGLGLDGEVRYEQTALLPGQFHPRIQRQLPRMKWRNPFVRHVDGAPMTDLYVRELRSSTAACGDLFHRLEQTFQHVEPHEDHLDVYGHSLRHLLILACTEVETAMKAILKANGFNPGRYDMKAYKQLLKPMRLQEWRLELSSHPGFPILSPFVNWPEKAPPPWWAAHTDTKHDRERELSRATLKATVDAMAAVFIMIAAQFGVEAIADSVGSALPFRVAEDGMPRWRAADFYVPPNLFSSDRRWSAIPLANKTQSADPV